MKKYIKGLPVLISLFILLLSFVSVCFFSFNAIGYLLLYLFLMLITFTTMVFMDKNFEISIVTSTTILILFFIIIGLLNLLKLTPLLLILISIICIYYLVKKKNNVKSQIHNLNKNSFIIFTVLFFIAILGGVGRYVHKWDEYSYWAYAAKVIINEDSLYSVISMLGATRAYPPVSNIWHYIVSCFCGYSEPNLYIGLSLVSYIYLMPVFMGLKDRNKDKGFTLLFVLASVFCPLLFNGSISYSLLYVDLLLGILCSCALILHNYNKLNKFRQYSVYLILVLITLLKANGFVFACSLILLFYLQDLFSSKVKFKDVFIKMRKYIIPCIIVLMLFIGWRIFASSNIIHSIAYDARILPDSLKTDLGLKFNSKFLLNFINSVILSVDQDIIYSFINIPLFAYLIIMFICIYFLELNDSKNNNFIKIILPYIITYIVFFSITALSLFVMFSQYEASTLASFGRYLAPINIALMLYVLYKMSYFKNIKYKYILCIIIISLVGFTNITFFFTDIRSRRDTMHISQARQNIFSTVVDNTSPNSKIFVINQTDDDNIMPLWYARYYCYPRIVNSNPNAITWKIKTKSNEWDLKKWGLTKEAFVDHLIDYDFDYVFFYSQTDELINELESIVDNKNDLKKYKLFKIVKQNDKKIVLKKVK